MSGWGWNNLFGGTAATKKDAPKNAILRLRSTLEMLSKREKHLQNQMDEQDAIARKNVSANKASKCHTTSLVSKDSYDKAARANGLFCQSQKQHYGGKRHSNTNSSKPVPK